MSASEGVTEIHYAEIEVGDVVYHPWTKQWSTVTGIDVHQSTPVLSKGVHDETEATYESGRTFHFDKGVDVESWEYRQAGMVARREK